MPGQSDFHDVGESPRHRDRDGPTGNRKSALVYRSPETQGAGAGALLKARGLRSPGKEASTHWVLRQVVNVKRRGRWTTSCSSESEMTPP